MVDAIGSDDPVGIDAQNILCRAKRPATCSGSRIDGLGQEEWDVFSQILKNAIRSLVRVDPVSCSNDRPS